mmetsp:Transcript_96238/g.269255  ORF Transcript_96238/g.269255 Transcript_96238/m.269255 type:complete len:365 (-) Transcript_96238:79-1173(-)
MSSRAEHEPLDASSESEDVTDDASGDDADGLDAEGSRKRLPSAPSAIILQETGYSESWVRYVAAEFVGTFILSLLSGLFTWGVFYHHGIEFNKANRALTPTLHLTCSEDILNRTCAGYITDPLAGAVFPGNMPLLCLFGGLAFSCISMLAPGATFNPSFTLMLCVGGLKRWGLLLPSVVAQLIAVILADWLIFFLLLSRMLRLAEEYNLNTDQALAMGEIFFGVAFPSPAFDNYFCFFYAAIANVIFVFLMMPMALRCMDLPPIAQACATGLVIGLHAAAFGVNGLGTLPNPAQWIGGALFLTWFGTPLNIWSRNSYYAWKVPMFAPTLGIFLGSRLAVWYIMVLYRKAAPTRSEEVPDADTSE